MDQEDCVIDAEGDQRKAAARAAGADVHVIEQEILRAKRTTLEAIAADYRTHIDQLKAFDSEGYAFDAKASKPLQLVFRRTA